MKNVWLILSFIFLIHPVLPVLDYVINYNYIIEVLCVNKDKKEMHCNGKCHLAKEVAKDFDDTDNTTHNNTFKKDFNLNLFLENFNVFHHDLIFFKFSKGILLYIEQVLNQAFLAIHLPPPKY